MECLHMCIYVFTCITHLHIRHNKHVNCKLYVYAFTYINDECIGYNTFVAPSSKFVNTARATSTQALHILTSYRNCQYEFIFTNQDSKSTRHFTSVIGVHRAYVSSKMYREIKLRSGIIQEKQLILLPHEEVHSTQLDVWNLSVEQGNIGTFTVTNIRIVWFADVNYLFNISVPYLTIASINIKNSKFGPTLVIVSTEASGGYILGFRVNPLERLNILHKEISVLMTAFEKSPIFGIEYTFEHQASLYQEIPTNNFNETQENEDEIPDVLSYYFFEGITTQAKPQFSSHLGLAIEDLREGSALQNLWELVPST